MMKVLFTCVLVVLICLHRTGAKEGVGSIHQRISAVPSRSGGPSKTYENGCVPTIHRPIKALHRLRRVPADDYGRIRATRYTTNYPKHHLLQQYPTPNTGFHHKSEQYSTAAPYTENHHSWKKTKLLRLK